MWVDLTSHSSQNISHSDAWSCSLLLCHPQMFFVQRPFGGPPRLGRPRALLELGQVPRAWIWAPARSRGRGPRATGRVGTPSVAPGGPVPSSGGERGPLGALIEGWSRIRSKRCANQVRGARGRSHAGFQGFGLTKDVSASLLHQTSRRHPRSSGWTSLRRGWRVLWLYQRR